MQLLYQTAISVNKLKTFANFRKLLKRLSSFAVKTSTPGKVAPKTSGELIGKTILNILTEEKLLNCVEVT